MPATTLNLTGENIIEANSYWSIDVLYPGNVTPARLRGQIRKAFGGELLADFRFAPPTYDEVADKTRFPVFLRSADTEKIPVPSSGSTWVYDLLIQLPTGDFKRILQGTVAVSPGATDV